ncbi:MAG: hypothetical protein ABI967_16725, partial [bacterium]
PCGRSNQLIMYFIGILLYRVIYQRRGKYHCSKWLAMEKQVRLNSKSLNWGRDIFERATPQSATGFFFRGPPPERSFVSVLTNG